MNRRKFQSAVVVPLAFSSLALGASGTFIDRQLANDVRVATWNIYNDSIFANTNATRNAKFRRVAAAVQADVWCFQEMYDHSAADVLALMNVAQPLPAGQTWHIYKSTEHVIASRFAITTTAGDTSPPGYRPVAMGLIDLPNATYAKDLYLMNAHYKCCGGFDPERQRQSDAFVNWMRDARTAGGNVTLPSGTPMVILGDLNLVDGPQPLSTLLDGNIINNVTFGADSPTDWDGSLSRDSMPLHNGVGPETWTWRDDNGPFAPGRLDYMVYTDSAIAAPHKFVLNTLSMSAADRATLGLQQFDTLLDNAGQTYDHLPVILDFRLNGARTLIWNPPATIWNTSNTNWLNEGAAASFGDGDVVRFTNVGTGAVTVAAGGVAPGAVIVSNSAGNYVFGGGAIGGAATLVKSGAGTLTLATANAFTGGATAAGGTIIVADSDGLGFGALAINPAGRVRAANGMTTALRVTSLSIAAGGAFDLADDDLVIDYTGASPLASIRSQIQQAFAGGAWTGNGLGSSTAAVSGGTGLAYAEASELLGSTGGAFAGRTVDGTSLLVRYTLSGDANLDLSVDIGDFSSLAAAFNQPGDWIRGDFNYDGVVNIGDFSLLASNFNVTAPRASVPEPGVTAWVALIGLRAYARRHPARVVIPSVLTRDLLFLMRNAYSRQVAWQG